MKLHAVLSVAVLLLLAACGGSSNPDAGKPVPEFYDPPSPLPEAAPGSVIRTGGVPDAPSGIRAQRIMYHSRTNDDVDIATTGLLVMPGGDPPPGGFPLVAAAHGTTGVVQTCAPSIHPFVAGQLASNGSFYDFFYKAWIDAGYAVVGADYQGEGAPGPYSFLVGQVEGQNVLDSVRAAQRIGGDLISDQLILYGHSQGGNSAGWAAEILPEYAPELKSSGVILAAPAASLHELLALAYRGGAGATLPNEAVVFLYLALVSYQDSYAGLDANDIVTEPFGTDGLPVFQNVCATTGGAAFLVNELLDVTGHQPPLPFKPTDFFIDLGSYPQPWVDAINLNALGNESVDTPMLIVQGCDDTTIPISTNFTYFNDVLCPADETVEFTPYPGQSHSGVVTAASKEMIEWADRRLRGEDAVSNCAVPPSCP